MPRTRGESVFNLFNTFLLILVCIATLYPLWYVIIASFSDPVLVATGAVTVWPKGFEPAAYNKIFEDSSIWRAYGNTIFYSVIGTAISMAFTVIGAYPLSKKRLPCKKLITFFVLLTMWFGAGMMPTYLNYHSLGLYDTRMGILLCGAIDTFNVVLMRTFFENVPDSMEESAKMDGANDWTILGRIYLPLSVPAIATLTMYYFVGRWNAWFWSTLLLKDQSKVPLQVLLRKLIVKVSYNVNEAIDMSVNTLTEQTMVYATIVVAVLPMLILYPFIQKFFVRGIMVGAIKG